MIQIIELLDELGIKYKSSGKNVSRNWIEVKCISPDCSDPSEHCGINLITGIFHCWICGCKGSITRFVQMAAQINYYQAKIMVAKFSDEIVFQDEKEEKIITGNILPKEATNKLPILHRNYLLKKNFDPDYLQRQYQIMACYTTGNYAYRLIIPIIINNIIVNFTARDVSEQQEPKYKNCPNEKAIIPMKRILYNIDTIRNKAIIVEGPTDVWRIGKGCCAMMGVEYTSTQLSMLANKNLEEIYIMYDEDAILKAEKLAIAVSAFCPKVEIIEIEGDPGDMPEEDALRIRREIEI